MSACSNTALLINGTIDAMASPNMASTQYGFHPILLSPFGAIGLEDSPHRAASLFKIDHLGRRRMPASAVKSGPHIAKRRRLTRGGPSFPLPAGARLPAHRACHETACSTAACEVAAGPTPR